MIKYIDGDLLKIKTEIIIHQVNTRGVMGAGLALQIKKKYPEVFIDYLDFCKSAKNTKDLLGECLIVEDYDTGMFVANIFAEDKYWPKGVCHTDYTAMEGSLKFLKTWMIANNIKTCTCPHMIGCGLANGDWDGVVHPMLKTIFENDDKVELTIVKYKK